MANPRINLSNITRVESPRFNGWRVEVRRNGKAYRKHFSFSKFKLADVLAARDQLLAEVPPSQSRTTPRSNGRVFRDVQTYQTLDGDWREFLCWTAWVRGADGRSLQTHWSVPKHGSAEAKRRAKLWLAAKLRERAQVAQLLHKSRT